MGVKNRLKQRRGELKLKQQDMASKCSIAFSTYVNIENGKAIPNLLTALKIAKVLRTSVNRLFALTSSRYRE